MNMMLDKVINQTQFLEFDYLKKHLESFLTQLEPYFEETQQGVSKTIQIKSIHELREKLKVSDFSQFSSQSLEDVLEVILSYTTRLRSPKNMGHQVAIPFIPSVLADFLVGVLNSSTSVFEIGSIPNTIEDFIVRWMLSKIDWSETGGGLLTSGGTLANMTCLLAARSKKCPYFWEEGAKGNEVILAPESSHYSVARSVSVLGFGAKNLVLMPVDSFGRVKVDELDGLLQDLISAGKNVVALVANATSTGPGKYDNLSSIGNLCQNYDIWMHVDGAHGAAALISDKHKHYLSGVEKADSLSWDTHKMMGTSALCGAALFKEKSSLDKIFQQKASYLLDGEEEMGIDFARYTFECTKNNNGLKLFFNFVAMGEEGLKNHVDHLHDITGEAYGFLEHSEDFSCLCEPDTNILCFQYLPLKDKSDVIRKKILDDGEYYITRTEVNGEVYLRLTISNPLTKLHFISRLCDKIRLLAFSI